MIAANYYQIIQQFNIYLKSNCHFIHMKFKPKFDYVTGYCAVLSVLDKTCWILQFWMLKCITMTMSRFITLKLSIEKICSKLEGFLFKIILLLLWPNSKDQMWPVPMHRDIFLILTTWNWKILEDFPWSNWRVAREWLAGGPLTRHLKDVTNTIWMVGWGQSVADSQVWFVFISFHLYDFGFKKLLPHTFY